MPRILRTSASQSDYADILDYIAADNSTAAEQLLIEFDAKLEMLAELPSAGRALENLAPRLRYFPVGKYLIFYRPLSDEFGGGIELLRVLQGSRDISPEFFRD